MRKFTLTEDHVKLLRHANVEYSDDGFDHGFVGLDCKRPFGNSDMVGDMARILGVELVPTDDGEEHWPPGTTDRMMAIFCTEIPVALEVILASGSFELGDYVADSYSRNWSRRETS